MPKPNKISLVKWIGPLQLSSFHFDEVAAIATYNQLTLIGHQ